MQLEILRLFLNINKQTFAKELGITQNTYTRYISGQRSIPAPISLFIMKKWNISINWLLSGIGEMHLSESEIAKIQTQMAANK
ncbi:MAG: helix-turn-helix transcriptional regulator [Minisyncoccales bacterium]